MSRHWATMKEAGALTGMRIMVWIYSVFGRSVFNVVLVPVMVYFSFAAETPDTHQ